MATKVKGDDGRTRYIVCPASGFLHPPRAVPLMSYKNKKIGAFSFCSCMTRVFINSPLWKNSTGLTADECKRRGIECWEID